MIEEININIDDIRGKLTAISSAIDISKLEHQILEVDRLSVEDKGFWADNSSKNLLREQSQNKKMLDNLQSLNSSIDDLEVLLELYNDGEESLATELKENYDNLNNQLSSFELKLILSAENDINSAIVTIHSGAGGTESNDWASMLFRMYNRYAERAGFKLEILDQLVGEEAGIKSITFNIIGDYAFGYLKGEIGVHRLVRLSPFDSANRRHTSFASVFVIPEIADNIDINILEADLRIDTYRAGGAGGQHLNTTDSAVRITHIPTNIVVACQNERSQHKNKAAAMKILKSRLYEYEQNIRNEEKTRLESSKTDIGWGNQIRSYVMHPYKMVKDLRTRYETGNVDAIMDGDIDAFIRSYLMFNSGMKV